MAKQVNHVFAKTREAGALYWHETAHADLDDAKSDAEELREGWQRARTKIVRGPDSFEWVRAKLDELNRVSTGGAQ